MSQWSVLYVLDVLDLQVESWQWEEVFLVYVPSNKLR